MTHLKPGDKAPDFIAADQQGNPTSLGHYKGRKLVLYFYPKDDTPGCTAQACNLRDNYSMFINNGFAVIGISPDPLKSHQKFTEKYHLPFPLIPDPDKIIIQAYGVWGPKKFMGRTYDGVQRTTFVIDENGTIEQVIAEVKTNDHAAQIIKP